MIIDLPVSVVGGSVWFALDVNNLSIRCEGHENIGHFHAKPNN